MGHWKWITLLLCLMAELCIYGQKRGDFLINQSIYGTKGYNPNPIHQPIIVHDFESGMVIMGEKPLVSSQADLGLTYFVINNLGISIDVGIINQEYLHKGILYGQSEIVSVLQKYNFKKYGLGPTWNIQLKQNVYISMRYLFSRYHYNNIEEAFFIPLKGEHFQHSFHSGLVLNVNTFFNIGIEFLVSKPTENLTVGRLKNLYEFSPITIGGGFVVAIRL